MQDCLQQNIWLALKSKLKSNIILLPIILCLLLSGCHDGQELLEEEIIEEDFIISEVEENVWSEIPYIDYDYIEQYHEILFHNIIDSPQDDYEDTVLAEYLKDDIEKDKKLMENGSGEGQPLTIDYHLFDFNDDGIEDYLVCMQGSFWSRDSKNIIRIYIQEENSTLQEVFEYYAYFSMPGHQPSVAVLSERVDGYHSLALSGIDSLLQYDEEKKWYEFCTIERYAEEEYTGSESHNVMTEAEYAEKKEMYKNIKHAEMSVFIDYEFIEEKHKILRHNICIVPQNAYDTITLKECLREDIEDSQRLYEEGIISQPLYIDYFPFDFNDDGLEDYLVCYHGIEWQGSGGNHVGIYIQESDGSLSMVFTITMRLYEPAWPNEHSPMAILDEKNDGYYAFVLVGNNRIIRYNKEENRYKFEDE